MKVNDILVEDRSYLYEGLTLTEARSVKLWETAGRKIYEAALTADQIQQLFQQVEQGATATGGNRTMIGQGKDLATAVKKAYDDLASKVQSSGPVQNIDQLYAQAAEKLKQATGGDAGAMQYVQKYRDFAKKHPIAQSLIYSALIAAAGISGAGLGGAAALGLFKMVDKLLQGEKFSTAVGKGLETGAMAYAAGQVGKAFQGAPGSVDNVSWSKNGIPFSAQIDHGKVVGDIVMAGQTISPTDPNYAAAAKAFLQAAGKEGMLGAAKNVGNANFSEFTESKYIDRQSTVRMWALKESLNRPRGGMQLTEAGVARIFSLVEDLNTGTGTPNPKKPPPPPPEDTQEPAWTGRKSAPATDAAPAEPASTPATPNPGAGVFGQMTNQLANTGTSSTGGQTQGTARGLTHTANPTNPNQPPASAAPATDAAPPNNTAPAATTAAPATNTPPATDPAPAATTAAPAAPAKKGILGKAADWAKTKGANLTNKVTADKLNTAWKKAGSPMDSDKLAQVLQGAGVDPQVINQAYTGLKIPAPATAPADPTQANTPADPAQAKAPVDATQANTTQAGQAEPDPIKDAGNWLKGRIPGTDAYNQRKLNKQDDAAIMKTAQGYVTQWTNGTKANPALNTPEELQKFGQRLATRANGKVLFKPELPKDMSQAGVTQYFKDIVARTTSGLETGDNSAADTSSNATNPGQNNWDKINKMAAGSETDPTGSETDPAQQAATAEPEKKKSGRVGKGAALKQVDQTVDAIKKVRTRDRPGVIQTAQTKIGALAGENPAQSAPAATTAAPAPEEEENPNIVRGYNEALQFSESFDPGALLWKKINR